MPDEVRLDRQGAGEHQISGMFTAETLASSQQNLINSLYKTLKFIAT
jgi:hypothetical protein